MAGPDDVNSWNTGEVTDSLWPKGFPRYRSLHKRLGITVVWVSIGLLAGGVSGADSPQVFILCLLIFTL